MSTVIEIGELRLRRVQRTYSEEKSSCKHFHLSMDNVGNVVMCEECGKQIDAYWALEMLSHQYATAMHNLGEAQRRHREAVAKDVTLLAAQRVERAWRSRTMAPMCPHCSEAILPEDGFGDGQVNKAMALRRRDARATGNAPQQAEQGRGP